ncbi:MAG: hypothetical protein SGJ19_12520 [Planctomycetia bacterium]|nr:hypothetical protein [Planctomycetia bacterium]
MRYQLSTLMVAVLASASFFAGMRVGSMPSPNPHLSEADFLFASALWTAGFLSLVLVILAPRCWQAFLAGYLVCSAVLGWGGGLMVIQSYFMGLPGGLLAGSLSACLREHQSESMMATTTILFLAACFITGGVAGLYLFN